MNKEKYVYETLIAAAREDVWKGLTMAEFTRQYWHSTRVNSDWAVDSRIEFLLEITQNSPSSMTGFLMTAKCMGWCQVAGYM